MTDAKLKECLGRLSALKWFPSNPQALAVIGEILRELCPADKDASELVREILRGFDEWPGPLTVRRLRNQIIEREKAVELERLKKEDRAAAIKARDTHEAKCAGFVVSVDDEHRVISVRFCGEYFGQEPPWRGGVECRKGGSLRGNEPGFCERKQAEELAARPGWSTSEQYWDRKLRSVA